MQSVNEAPTTGLELVDADTLRAMTISKEELLEKQKRELLESLMGSMLALAQQNGSFEYSALLNPNFDSGLLTDIRSELSALGYSTLTTEQENPNLGPCISLHISWKEEDVSN